MQLLPPEEEIHKLLAFVTANEASDLHLKVGYPPTVRIGGHLRRIESPNIPDSEYVEKMIEAIMVQRLLPGVKEGSRFPATEVLVNNSIVRDKIIREEDEDIPAVLHACRDEGMRDFTQSIFELAEKAWITHDVALDYAPNREALQSRMKGIDTAGQGLISRVRK